MQSCQLMHVVSQKNCEKMAESGGGDGNGPKKPASDREERIRVLRERQADERLRRLEDLKKQALETQQLREQKEAERRQRMEELRTKDNERRLQVEGRKKMINDAEQERREAILRKNMERDARMENKRRNDRSSNVFAFGSSTPRLLETYDSMFASYWGPRRATSTANLRHFPSTAPTSEDVKDGTPRRPSEREQDSKKRAASAGGLYRTPAAEIDDGWTMNHVGRRKTDLMPTTPSPRDPTSRPGSGSRSLARTPARAVSMARLDQLSRPRAALSRSTNQLADPTPLRAAKSMVSLGRAQTTVAPPRTTRAERLRQRARAVAAARSPTSDDPSSSGDVTPSRPGSVMSQSSYVSSSTVTTRLRSVPRRPRPSSIHVTGLSKDKLVSPSEDKPKFERPAKTPPLKPQPLVTKKQNQQKNEEIKKQQLNSKASDEKTKAAPKKKEPVKVNGNSDEANSTVNPTSESKEEQIQPDKTVKSSTDAKTVDKESGEVKLVNGTETNRVEVTQTEVVSPDSQMTVGQDLLVDLSDSNEVLPVVVPSAQEVQVPVITSAQPSNAEEKASVQSVEEEPANKGNAMTRSHITSEEEAAKERLAERRRQAREQAEREAEAERQRLAREAAEEAERLAREEEEQRLAEEEQLRMIEEARKIENERLMLAIQEAQRKEEEEKERQRLEELARIEKEEADRLAREEAEKARQELAERLKREEDERQARRKRVEAIMKRTRNAAPSNKPDDGEKGAQDGAEHEKDESKGSLEAFLHGERLSADSNLTNGQGSPKPDIANRNEETHTNGVSTGGLLNEDCVNSNPPVPDAMTTPLIAFQGKSKDTPLPADLLA